MEVTESKPLKDPWKLRLLDPIPLHRHAVAWLIQDQPDLELVGLHAEPSDLLRALESVAPDLVILELSDKDGAGLNQIRDLRIRHPRLRLLVLSSHSENIFAERSLQAGANGFVSKAAELAVILAAIRKVAMGETYFSEQLSARLALRYLGVGASASASPLDGLSNRELQVFRLIGSGLPTRAIAEALGISVKTVETYIDHLKHKLGVESGVALAHRAVQWMERGILQ